MRIRTYDRTIPTELLSQCADIWVDCFTGPPRFENWTRESAQEELRKYLESSSDFVLAQPDEHTVAAFGIGVPVAKHYGGVDLIAAGAHPESYYFVALGTKPEYRRQGLGALLLEAREALGRERGYSVMTVRLRADSEEILRLLTRAGFTETGRYHASIGDSLAERLIMTKFVNVGLEDN